MALGFFALALIPKQSLFKQRAELPRFFPMVSSPCSPPLVARGLALERPLRPWRCDVTVPQPAFSVTALVEVASLPAAACRQRSGAAMSTSLGSNTYNRQNWEDAVSWGGSAAPGEPGRAGMGRRGPFSAAGACGAARPRGEGSAGRRPQGWDLPWGPATFRGDPPPALEPPGGLCRGSPALLTAQRKELAPRSFPSAAVQGL